MYEVFFATNFVHYDPVSGDHCYHCGRTDPLHGRLHNVKLHRETTGNTRSLFSILCLWIRLWVANERLDLIRWFTYFYRLQGE
jgi:hypothetical protein